MLNDKGIEMDVQEEWLESSLRSQRRRIMNEECATLLNSQRKLQVKS